MIIETIIASVAAITIAGTWLGLRFARNTMHRSEQEPERQEALALMEEYVQQNSPESKQMLRAMLVTRPEILPRAARFRAIQWLSGKPVDMPQTEAP